MLDSIYGSKEFIQDWVYFTPNNKFWRCSWYNESYVIDSSLTYSNQEVSLNGQLKYSIYSIDTSSILLVTPDDNVLRCKRWNAYDPERIANFIQSNPKKKLLSGNWTLDSSEVNPTVMPSYCKNLYLGSKFTFNQNGTFDVFPKDSTNKCNSYSYHIWENQVSITEYDMMMHLDIVKLTADKLILKSTYVPSDGCSEKMMEAKQKGYNLYLTKQNAKN